MKMFKVTTRVLALALLAGGAWAGNSPSVNRAAMPNLPNTIGLDKIDSRRKPSHASCIF